MSGLKTLGFAVDDHDPRSIELYQFIEDMDYECGDTFCFKHGGDGDNGELLLSYLDEWFSSKPICDRDALLALADEMRESTRGMLSDDHVDASDVWYYEHLLRKAVGA